MDKGTVVKTYFHPLQLLHHPRSYLSHGQMRSPQEVPERATKLVAAARAHGFDAHEGGYHLDSLEAKARTFFDSFMKSRRRA